MSDLRRYWAERWDAEDATEKLYLTHELNENSIVLDVGGYTGAWAREIVDRYDPNIYVFEPVPQFCDELRKKFRHNEKVRIKQYGLASGDAFLPMFLHGSATTLAAMADGELFQFRRAVDAVIEVLGVASLADVAIDLIAINVEGGEYDLLDHMIKSGLAYQCREIMVQFHTLWPSSYDEWKRIRGELNKTHYEAWSFPMVWEKWVRR